MSLKKKWVSVNTEINFKIAKFKLMYTTFKINSTNFWGVKSSYEIKFKAKHELSKFVLFEAVYECFPIHVNLELTQRWITWLIKVL